MPTVLIGPEVMLNSTDRGISMAHKTKMLKYKDVSFFQTLRCYIYHANKCLNANNCWHFNIYEHDQFYAQLS